MGYDDSMFECGSTEIRGSDYVLKRGSTLLVKEPSKESALDTVLAERGNTYGRFADNAFVAQNLKRAMHTEKFYKLSADKQEALDQIASKISRIVTASCSEYKDSWVDIAGYATLVADTLGDEK